MNLQNFRYLVSVAETGSITRTSEELNVTQPAVSRGIAALESELGVPLFDRLPKKMQLTRFGEIALRRGRAIFQQIEQTQQEIDDIRNQSGSRFAIGAGPVWLSELLPQAIRLTADEMSWASIEIIGGYERYLLDLLRRGEVSFVLAEITQDPEFADLDMEPLTSADYSLLARPGHPLATGEPVELSDLLRCSWIMPSAAVNAQNRLAGLFNSQGMSAPEPEITSTSLSFISKFVSISDHLTFLVESSQSRAEGLVRIPTRVPLPRRVAGIQRRKDDWINPEANRVIEFLRLLSQDIESH